MSVDETAGFLIGVDIARPLPARLRGGLERALRIAEGPEVVALHGIDRPRDLPWALRTRLELRLTTPRRSRVAWRFIPLVAATIVVSGAVGFALVRAIDDGLPGPARAIPVLTPPPIFEPFVPPHVTTPPPVAGPVKAVTVRPRSPRRPVARPNPPAPPAPEPPAPEPPPAPSPEPSCTGTLAQLGAAVAEPLPAPVGPVVAQLTCPLP